MHKWLIAGLPIIVSASASFTSAQESPAFSSEVEKQNYLTIVDVRITEVPTKDLNGFPTSSPPRSRVDALGGLGPIVADPSNIGIWITFGQKVWDLVVANRPVANVQSARVSVLPKEHDSWALMSGWHGPVSTSYQVAFLNSYGTTVVDHIYAVTYSYGGNVNGQGQYLANLTIAPTAVKVAWGFALNSSVDVGQVLNMGTTESPVPSVDLQLKWEVKTVLQDWQGGDHFFVRGDGTLLRLGK